MKIVFIGQKETSDASSNTEQYIEKVVPLLIEKGHEVTVVRTFRALVLTPFQRYDVIHCQSKNSSTFQFFVWLIKLKSRMTTTFCTTEYCIPSGAEVAFESDPESLTRFGLRPKRYVLSVGRLVEEGDVHYLIKAFQELERMGKMPNNFKLAIVGASAETPEYEKYLKVMSEKEDNILFLGEQSGRDLAALFSHAALFVQPSPNEDVLPTLLEAMGYGIMPLVADTEANVETVKNDGGVVFRNKDVESLKTLLAYYINRPEEAEKIGAVAKERVEEQYSWDAIASRTIDVYREALDKEPSHKNYAHVESK